MSGFLRHIAARGMGQAGAVHSAARLPYASAPALAEAVGESTALPPSLPRPPRSGPVQEPTPGPIPARPDEVSERPTTAASRPPAPLLRGSLIAAAAADAALPDDRKATGAAEDRPLGRAADGPGMPMPDPILPAAAQKLQATPAVDDEGSAPLRRIPPLLPPQPNGTASFKAASGHRDNSRRAPVEETTEVHVSIGRIEVTAVHEAAPAPKRAPARGQRALSLEDYLARRKAGRS